MNTPDAFDLFDTLIDEYSTGLATRDIKTHFLNLAIRDVIEDRVRPKDQRKGYSLQSDKRMRSELKELYVVPANPWVGVAMSNGIYSYPTDYKYPIWMYAKNAAGEWKRVSFEGGNNVNEDDPFIDGQEEPWAEEASTGIVVHAKYRNGVQYVVTEGVLAYLKRWTDVSEAAPISASTTMTVGDLYYVKTGSVSYNSSPYSAGETFTVVAGTTTFSGSGTAAKITNAEISDDLMRECVRLAAGQYMASMDEDEQAMKRLAENLSA